MSSSKGIQEWIHYILEPRSELSGMPICPYAKLATRSKAYSIDNATLESISEQVRCADMNKNLVSIFVFEQYLNHTEEELLQITKELNTKYNPQDLVILDNDPRAPLVVNGVTTTYSECYLWLVQSLSDLNNKSKELKKTTYYDHWTQQQLDEVVTWRTK